MIIAYYKRPKCGIIYEDHRSAISMNTRSFINPKELLREGKRIVNQSGDTKYVFRVAMVRLTLCYNVHFPNGSERLMREVLRLFAPKNNLAKTKTQR